MSSASHPLLQHYVKLTEFLGRALGPDYEVALHDLTDKNRSIIAIANNHISGREIGAPLTNMALSILKDRRYEKADYMLNYYGISVNGKDLRSNTFYIKQNGKLIGMLCINFDDSRYHKLSQEILNLCHPDPFTSLMHPEEELLNEVFREEPEKFRNSTEAVVADAVARKLEQMGCSAQRLTSEERLQIIASLEEGGIFLLKGAVKDAAAALRCSQASIYRYLNQIRSEE